MAKCGNNFLSGKSTGQATGPLKSNVVSSAENAALASALAAQNAAIKAFRCPTGCGVPVVARPSPVITKVVLGPSKFPSVPPVPTVTATATWSVTIVCQSVKYDFVGWLKKWGK